MKVIKVLEFIQLHADYKVTVKAETDQGKVFNYTFIKNRKEDAEAIIIGYEFEMGCKPIAI